MSRAPGMLLSLVLAASLAPAAAAESAAVVEGISVDPRPDGLVLNVRVSASGSPFTLRWPTPTGREVVLVLPGASHHLENTYQFDGGLIRSARVETQDGGTTGVVLRFVLADDAVIAAVEQAGGGLRMHLVRVVADRAPVPSDYRIGVGDKLELAVFGHEDLTNVVEVRADGTINLPLVGNLTVSGKSVAEVDELLTRRLGEDFLVDPQVSVDVREYQSQWVTVIGEVRTPGRYVLKRNMRLIDLLAESGGATKDAGNGIHITRRPDGQGDAEQIRVERGALLSRDNQAANILLRHGDIVTLSEKEVFYIRGEVNKPGPYYLENEMTLMKAIAVAGGLGPFSNRKEIELLRAEPGGRSRKIEVNLKAIEDGKAADIPLLPNDTVIVPRRLF